MQGYSGFRKATSASYSGRQRFSPRHRRGWFYCQCEASFPRWSPKRACSSRCRNFKSTAPASFLPLPSGC